jgi:phosphohistidine phosphatase
MSSAINIFLMRHADAVPELEDPDRPLSGRGRRQVDDMAAFFKMRGNFDVGRVWHSPLLRAVQTADLFCDQLGIDGTRRMIDGLLPFDDVDGVARRLSGFGYPLLIVGHEPHLGRLAADLVTGDPDQEIVNFKKGAVLCLEREESKSETALWTIRWFVTPALVRAQT